MVDRRGQGWLRTAAVELDPDLWDALQAAADQAGLAVGEYIREAVLARLAADTATDARGEAVQRARMARLTAAARSSEAAALRAQAGQMVRRAGAATRHSAEVLASGEAGMSNVAYVRALWAAFEAGGVAGMAALVPPDVRWQPLAAGGRVLVGTDELTEFWVSRDAEMPSLRMFHVRGGDVLVEAEYGQDQEAVSTIWLLYRFERDRLVEAIAFPDEAQAHEYIRPSASDDR